MLLLLVRAEQVPLFGDRIGPHPVRVRGHVRVRRDGKVAVVAPHQRDVQGGAPQVASVADEPTPPPVAPDPTRDPWDQLPAASRAALDMQMRTHELDPGQISDVWAEAQQRLEAGRAPTREKAFELAAAEVKMRSKLDELITPETVLASLERRDRWYNTGEIEHRFVASMPIIAGDRASERVTEILTQLRADKKITSYYSNDADGPWMRIDVDEEAERKKHLGWAMSDLEEFRRRLPPILAQRDRVRAEWGSMPAELRGRWPEFHPALKKDLDQLVSSVRRAEDEALKHGGTLDRRVGDDGELRAPTAVEPEGTVPPDAPAEDPRAYASDAERDAHEADAGHVILIPEHETHGFHREWKPTTRVFVKGRTEIEGRRVPVPAYSAQASGRNAIVLTQPAVSVMDPYRSWAWGTDALKEHFDRGASVIGRNVPEIVYRKLAEKAPDVGRIVSVQMDDGPVWVGYGSEEVAVDAGGRLVRGRERLARISAAAAQAGAAMAKASKDVEFTHPEEGRRKRGTLVAQGEKGATIHDHETGAAVKVPHGSWWTPDAPNLPTDAPPKPAAPAEGDEKPLSLPGLDDSPAAAAKPSWAGDPIEGLAADKRPKARADHDARTERVVQTGQRLGPMRRRIGDHLRAGGVGESAVHAVLLSALEQTGADPVELLAAKPKVDADGVTIGTARVESPRAAAIVKAMKARGARGWQFAGTSGELEDVTPETLAAYARRVSNGLQPDDLRRFRAATHAIGHLEGEGGGKMLPSERNEKLGRAHEAAVHAMGDGADQLVDPGIARAYHRGHRFDDPQATGDTAHELLTDTERRVVGHLAKVRESDPWGVRGGQNGEADPVAGRHGGVSPG